MAHPPLLLLWLVALFGWAAGLCMAQAQSPVPDTIPPTPMQRLVAAPPGASHLSVDEEGNLLVLCRDYNRLYKFLRVNDYDSSIAIGGNALGREGLNQPSDVWAQDRQTVYVLDAGNRRLMLYNTNLRMVRTVDFLATPVRVPGQEPFNLNPAAFTSNSLGELFVLNQDDNRVYKFDRFGQFELVFGGSDFGTGRLLAPTQLMVSNEQLVYIAEPEHHRIMVFDFFGTFREQIDTPDSLRWLRMSVLGDVICIAQWDTVMLFRHETHTWLTVPLPEHSIAPVTDAVLTVRGLYLLSRNDGVFLLKL